MQLKEKRSNDINRNNEAKENCHRIYKYKIDKKMRDDTKTVTISINPAIQNITFNFTNMTFYLLFEVLRCIGVDGPLLP